jgi:hypothetical protein
MELPPVEGDSLSQLLALARRCRVTRRDIGRLAADTPVDLLREALSAGLAGREIHTATALALAFCENGGLLELDVTRELFPEIDDMSVMMGLAGRLAGDRVAHLITLVEEDRLSSERDAACLFLAAELLGGAPPPRQLITQIRSAWRLTLSAPARMLLQFAALTLNDPDVNEVVGPLPRRESIESIRQPFLDLAFGPLLDGLPENDRVLVSGYTHVRTTPKVGRNDPCHCGSGRKFKKCCAGKKEQEAAVETLVEKFVKAGNRDRHLRDQLFERMRPADLAQLDPATLGTNELIDGIPRLTGRHYWDAAIRWMDILAERTDLPGTPSDHRIDLAESALSAGELDIAEQLLSQCELSENDALGYQMQFALRRRTADAFDLAEGAAAAAHRDDDFDLTMSTALALLQSSPALGIFVARGALRPDRPFDSELLLEEIERARDRLDLRPHDPWIDLYESLFETELDDQGRLFLDEVSRRQQQELDELRSSLREANRRGSSLGRELEQKVAQLESLSSSSSSSADRSELPDVPRQRIEILEEERRRLRMKIESLEGEIREGAAQRSELRRDLARLAEKVQKETQPRQPVPEDHDDDSALVEPTTTHPRRIVIPEHTAAARKAITAAPDRAARAALHEIFLIAAGDENAWREVKQMRSASHILTTRIGRSMRLLFRIEEGRLEVLDLILRRDLQRTVERLSR